MPDAHSERRQFRRADFHDDFASPSGGVSSSYQLSFRPAQPDAAARASQRGAVAPGHGGGPVNRTTAPHGLAAWSDHFRQAPHGAAVTRVGESTTARAPSGMSRSPSSVAGDRDPDRPPALSSLVARLMRIAPASSGGGGRASGGGPATRLAAFHHLPGQSSRNSGGNTCRMSSISPALTRSARTAKTARATRRIRGGRLQRTRARSAPGTAPCVGPAPACRSGPSPRSRSRGRASGAERRAEPPLHRQPVAQRVRVALMAR